MASISVRQALERLPSKARRFIELHYFAGVPDWQAAELLGYSPRSAKRLLTRTLEKLRKSLT